MDYVPASQSDREYMLKEIGVSSIDDLLSCIPAGIVRPKLDVPEGISEFDAAYQLKMLAHKNKRVDHYKCFLGAGAYDHCIPSVVPALASRSEFYTAYTPYQPEASQGTLQAVFEYQSMICELTGLDAANASLYEGGSACAEAALMIAGSGRGKTDLILAGTMHPWYRDTVKTYVKHLGLNVIDVPHRNGVIDAADAASAITDKTAGLIIQSPNFYGCIEENLAEIVQAVHQAGGLVAMSCNPLSLSVLKSPGEYGVDIAVGDGQPLGVDLQYGGPYFGFLACTNNLLRKMPGRIVGMTKDSQGRRTFVLTLQAREQHIRREKATSNICTNQALIALRGNIFLSWAGKEGFYEMGRQNVQRAHYAAREAANIDGVTVSFDKPFFNEFCLNFESVKASAVLDKMMADGIFGGVPLSRFDALNDKMMVVCVTEKRSKDEIDSWIMSLKKAVRN
jgi:glycine dehydrogenase subunit 1